MYLYLYFIFLGNEIGFLFQLQHLDLRNNLLSEIPFSLGLLDFKMIALYVDGNLWNTSFTKILKPIMVFEFNLIKAN